MATDEDTARGLVRIEGYLLWSAELEEARRQAARFAGQLPWLTTAQRDEVERVYTADRVAVSRAVLVRISGRAAELRGEYTARYEQLKRRCVSVTVMAVGAVSGTYTAIALLSR
ncbi:MULTISPECIES: hypothetical protein [unclassified Streptomyces]|uniref:hypothetical protein n=1 Tax=unclassified Streptomyces TaxID=2593676 RepID=UPI002E107728|nr:hypothetical protein OG452_08035 [Streptomyces sp. NBC_01197]WSS52044.1 hypothetical protein OG708_27450 [Streptomyces sp. NBC_01180]